MQAQSCKDESMSMYRIQETILQTEERSLYHALTLVVAQRALLLSKVKLSAMLEPLPELSTGRDRTANHSSLEQHTIDFVVCDRQTTRPLFVVLVDGPRGPRGSHRDTNTYLQQLCADAGLPVLRIKQAGAYRMDLLQRLIEPLLVGDSRGTDYAHGDRVTMTTDRITADKESPVIPRPGTMFSPN
jgi:hypothetical protein